VGLDALPLATIRHGGNILSLSGEIIASVTHRLTVASRGPAVVYQQISVSCDFNEISEDVETNGAATFAVGSDHVFLGITAGSSNSVNMTIFHPEAEDRKYKQLATRLSFGLPGRVHCRHTRQPLVSDSLWRKPLVLDVLGNTFFSMPIIKFEVNDLANVVHDIWHVTKSDGVSRVGTKTVKADVPLTRSEFLRVLSGQDGEEERMLYDLVAVCGGPSIGADPASLICRFDGTVVWRASAPPGNGGCPHVRAAESDRICVVWATYRNVSLTVQVLKLQTGAVLSTFEIRDVFKTVPDEARFAAGSRLALSGEAKDTQEQEIAVFDLETKQVLLKASEHLGSFETLSDRAFVMTPSKLVFYVTRAKPKNKIKSFAKIIDHW